jgi:hypothetical protein
MRKAYLSWLLPLLMLLSQQGAFAHALGHLRPPTEQQQNQEKRQDADKLCEKCLAFAHLADLATPPAFHSQLLSLSFDFEATEAPATVAADAPAARSRGPPTFL